MNSLRIESHKIGAGFPCFIIAEAGVNHNGNIDLAYELVDVAVRAGADAVKFQTFKADQLVTSSAPKANYQLMTTGEDESQLDMLRRLELSGKEFRDLASYCRGNNILFMSTPFDDDSLDFLIELGVGVVKVASGELTNIPFLNRIASKNIPLIISTGMATLGEVETAVQAVEQAGHTDFVLLHCTSSYPTNPVDVNLRAMLTMQTAFDAPVGLSDHTMGIEIAIAAVALGAAVIEKHFTLDKDMDGPDHRSSLEPDEFSLLVRSIRTVEAAMGDGRKQPTISERDTANVVRKSLAAACNIENGTMLTEKMITAMRPGIGMPPRLKESLIGRRARVNITKGTLFNLEMLS